MPGPTHCSARSTAPVAASAQKRLVWAPPPAVPARQRSSTTSTRPVLGERRGAEAAAHGDAEAHSFRLPVGAHQVHEAAGLGGAVQELGRVGERVRAVEAGGDQHLAEAGGGDHAAAIGGDDHAGAGAPEAAFALFGQKGGLGGSAADAELEAGAGRIGAGLGRLRREGIAGGESARQVRPGGAEGRVAASAERE